jgi:hypothetical protein
LIPLPSQKTNATNGTCVCAHNKRSKIKGRLATPIAAIVIGGRPVMTQPMLAARTNIHAAQELAPLLWFEIGIGKLIEGHPVVKLLELITCQLRQQLVEMEESFADFAAIGLKQGDELAFGEDPISCCFGCYHLVFASYDRGTRPVTRLQAGTWAELVSLSGGLQ